MNGKVMNNTIILVLVAIIILIGCKNGEEGFTENLVNNSVVKDLFGQDLMLPDDTEELKKLKAENIQSAKMLLDSIVSKEHLIWYGRRLAYNYQYREAIHQFTKGLEKYPDDPELLRHRGHRFISIRDFDSAIEDLEKAARLAKDLPIQIEADGIPNKLNKPLSNLQFNIWYHLGLAHYLKGDFKKAVNIYEQCLDYCDNADLKIAVIDWLYMAYRRLGEHELADLLLKRVSNNVVLVENEDYLKRILMYKGQFSPSDMKALIGDSEKGSLANSTLRYGLANYYFYTGDTDQAKAHLNEILSSGYWPSFGYIAAEADLHRLSK